MKEVESLCECGHPADLHNKHGCRAVTKWTGIGDHGMRGNWAAQPLKTCNCLRFREDTRGR